LVNIYSKPEKPTITRKGYTLYSSSKTGNQWFFFDQPIENATADSLPVDTPGLYYVQVTNEYGCKSEMSDPFDFYFNTVEDYSNTGWIYPNPASNRLFITYPTDFETISIIDLYGRKLIEITYESYIIQNYIDISSLSVGTYFVVIKTEKGNLVNRFIKIQ
jgi:hypothetical protein